MRLCLFPAAAAVLAQPAPVPFRCADGARVAPWPLNESPAAINGFPNEAELIPNPAARKPR